jgi:hypothetical protein
MSRHERYGDETLQELYVAAAVAGIGGAVLVVGMYHVLVAAPYQRRLRSAFDAHDALLGGGGAAATDRLAAIDRRLGEGDARAAEAAKRIATLEATCSVDVYRLGFVRYNAFDDVGSDLSFALALVNAAGDGIVLSSIYSREDTRTYGKAVAAYKTVVDASVEERSAIERARTARA